MEQVRQEKEMKEMKEMETNKFTCWIWSEKKRQCELMDDGASDPGQAAASRGPPVEFVQISLIINYKRQTKSKYGVACVNIHVNHSLLAPVTRQIFNNKLLNFLDTFQILVKLCGGGGEGEGIMTPCPHLQGIVQMQQEEKCRYRLNKYHLMRWNKISKNIIMYLTFNIVDFPAFQ